MQEWVIGDSASLGMRRKDESLGTWGDAAADGAADGDSTEDHTGGSADDEVCKGDEEWSCVLEGNRRTVLFCEDCMLFEDILLPVLSADFGLIM